jgi:hydroxymethylglutaryl-CoA synthase
MKVGIDSIRFYTPRYCLDLEHLARMRGIDPQKIKIGLGQERMSIPSIDEDVVTMALEAASLLPRQDLDRVDMVLFATETGVDQSKAAGIFVHKLLNLSPYCRVVELKQACYSATIGMQLAMTYLRTYPHNRILLISSDIARYTLNTPAESSQGAGAVAMLLSANPKILEIEKESGFYTEDVMDFWRPNYLNEAIVDGRYSCEVYLKVLKKTWKRYCEVSGRSFEDHDHFCYHVPIPKLALKAHHYLASLHNQKAKESIDQSLSYIKNVGNCYTASLPLALLSLLENASVKPNDRIAMYSYGSGCVGEFLSGIVQENYEDGLLPAHHKAFLQNRIFLSFDEYEEFYNSKPTPHNPVFKTSGFRFTGIDNHKRIYTYCQ